MTRVVWTAVLAVIMLLGAVSVAVWLPDRSTLALVLAAGSITFAIMSFREGR